MDYTQLQAGQRVFYTGDMANEPCWCTLVTCEDVDARWGLSYDLTADGDKDPTFLGIRPAMFSGIGRRFVVKAEYDAERAAKMDAMRKQFAKMGIS